MAFSLTEKLAVTGAFLAVVALVVGTEDDPGLVVTGQDTVKELRPVAPPQPAIPSTPVPQPEAAAPQRQIATLPVPQVSPSAAQPVNTEVREVAPTPGVAAAYGPQGRRGT